MDWVAYADIVKRSLSLLQDRLERLLYSGQTELFMNGLYRGFVMIIVLKDCFSLAGCSRYIEPEPDVDQSQFKRRLHCQKLQRIILEWQEMLAFKKKRERRVHQYYLARLDRYPLEKTAGMNPRRSSDHSWRNLMGRILAQSHLDANIAQSNLDANKRVYDTASCSDFE